MKPASLAPTPPQPGRLWRAWLCVFATTLWAGSACFAAEAARDAGSAAVEVAAGVYMVRGAAGEPDPANQGRVGNAGFIVGPTGVIAIDTGTSYAEGVALLAAVARVTDQPVRIVIVTHTRQEFLFGAAAYRERGIMVHMHRDAARLMAARCEGCLKTLRRVLGDEAMRGTTMFHADHEFDAAQRLDLIGRPVRVLFYGHSSGPGDVAVFDEATGVLFAGGLLDQQRIPDVQDSDLPGWKRALDALRRLPIRTIVPGHGPAAGPQLVGVIERYLGQLQGRVLELLSAGAALSEVPDAVALPEFQEWDQYDTIHRRNASIVFLRFEREQMYSR